MLNMLRSYKVLGTYKGKKPFTCSESNTDSNPEKWIWQKYREVQFLFSTPVGDRASWLAPRGICYLCEFQPESQTHGPKNLIILAQWMWSHLSGVNHKPKRNHHQTNQILKPTCLAYVSVKGSTGDRWHAEIRIIGGGFSKGVINIS